MKHSMSKCYFLITIFKTVISGPAASLRILENQKENVTIIRCYNSDKIYKNVTIICIFKVFKNPLFGYPPLEKTINQENVTIIQRNFYMHLKGITSLWTRGLLQMRVYRLHSDFANPSEFNHSSTCRLLRMQGLG